MSTQQMLDDIKKRQELENYRRNQKRYKLANTLDTMSKGVLSLPNAYNKTKNAITFGKNVVGGMKQGQNLLNAWKGAKAISDASKAGALAATGNVTNMASTVGNTANTASAVGNTANAASTAGNAANVAGKVGSAVSKAGPALGAVGGALSVGANLAKKDYAGAGMEAAATAAALAGGPVGWGVWAAMQIGKMIKGAREKKKQKALAKSQEQLNETMQQAAEKKQENITQFDNDALASNTMPNQSMLAGPTSPAATQSEQIMQDHLETGLDEAPTSSNETDGTEDISGGTPTGAAANINQGYMGALPELGVENSTGGWGQNVLNAMDAAKGLGYGQDVIDAIPQGLNSGHADIAGLIDKYTINKPTTPDEVDLARKGEFNTAEAPEFSNYIPQEQQAMASANAPSLTDSINQEVNNQPVQDNSISQIMDKYVQTKEPKSRKQEIIDNMMSKFRGGLGDLVEGYRDNAYTSFGEGDLVKGMTGAAASAEPKSFMNRLGEAIGTGSRVISNPGVQGLVAGAIKGANTGDWGTGLEYGVNWAANKAKSDNYYKKMNPNAKRNPIFSNYDSKDYNAHTLEGYRAANVNKNMQTAENLANAMLGSGRWSEQEAQDFINANGADAQIPVQLFNYLLKDNQAAEKITADMSKHQDNFGEKVRHNKASEEIGRTNAGANVTRAGAYAASKTEDDTDYSSGESVDSNITVRVMGPDGKIRRIPENRLEEAIAAGGRRI